MPTALEKYQALQVNLENLLAARNRCERKIRALDADWNQHPYFEGNRPSRATLDREDERIEMAKHLDEVNAQLRAVGDKMDALAPAVDAEDRAARRAAA